MKTLFDKKNVSQTFFPYFQILFICTNGLDLICLILHHWQLVFWNFVSSEKDTVALQNLLNKQHNIQL